MRYILPFLCGAFFILYSTHAKADILPFELRYDQEIIYQARVTAELQKMQDLIPSKPGCVMPMRISKKTLSPTLTLRIRNDTTREAVQVGGQLNLDPFAFYPSAAIELINPLIFGPINLERHRITLEVPWIAKKILIKTDLFFAWITGTMGEKLNLTVRLESVEETKKYCSVIYTITGRRVAGPQPISKPSP